MNKRLPWWTWLAPLVVCHIGTQLSVSFQLTPGTSMWYLPIALGLAMVIWWGPRVLLGVYLNSLVSAGLWGLSQIALYPLYAMPETLVVGLAWYMYIRRAQGSVYLRDLDSYTKFVVYVVGISLATGVVYHNLQLILFGDVAINQALWPAVSGWVADMLGVLAVTVPLLVLASPWMYKRGWLAKPEPPPVHEPMMPTGEREQVELGAAAIALLAMSLTLSVDGFWYLFGLLLLAVAIRHGFRQGLVFTTATVVLTVVLPAIVEGAFGHYWVQRASITEELMALVVLCLSSGFASSAVMVQRKHIEELMALRDEASTEGANLRAILESTHDLVWCVDEEGGLIVWNQAFATFVEKAADGKLSKGARLEDLLPADLLLLSRKDLHQAFRGKPLEAERHLPSMKSIELRVNANPVWLNGEVVAVAAFARDLSHERELEERIRHSDKMQAIGQLAGGIAHDFNNQLTCIMGFAELLDRRLVDPKEKGYLANVLNASKHAADLTSKLLAFARRGNNVRELVDMHQVIGEITNMLSHTIDKRVSIQTQLRASRATVEGDASQLQNALLNLALNARDAMPEGGTLTFGTSVVELTREDIARQGLYIGEGETLALSVRDTGCGMTTDVMARIFEPFFSTKEERGTGMGLAAVYGTLKAHEGDITVWSEAHSGSCFTLYLPITVDMSRPPAESRTAIDTASLKRMRILVVDDEPMVRTLMTTLLQSIGCMVTTMEDGLQAVEWFAENPTRADLVLMDMIMPNMNGRDAFRQMKTINPKVKVILISGYRADQEVEDLLRDGVYAFLTKPCDQDELLQTIKEAVG